MKSEDVLSIASQLLRQAAGYEADADVTARKKALDYYLMRERGDEVEGRSRVVSGDLSAMVDAVASQIMDAYTSESIAEFAPFDGADEDQCQLETDVVTHFVWHENNGYMLFSEAVKDPLLQRNAVVKGWIETREETNAREFESVTPEAYAGIKASPGYSSFEEVEYRPKDGYLKIREKRKVKKLRLQAIPPENFVYTKDWPSLDLTDIPLCGERHIDTRSDMIAIHKFNREQVDKLQAHIEHKEDATARNPKGESPTPANTADKSLDQVMWFELYMLLDADGDGVAERRRVCIVPDQELLKDEDSGYCQYAAGTTLLMPHRFRGISLYDKLKQNQDVGTGLKRLALDNAEAATKQRTSYLEGKAEVDDLNNGLVNGNIRVRGVQDVRQALATHGVPDVSVGLLAHIQEQKRERSELGGAALDLATAQAQLTDRVGSEGVDRVYSVAEQLAGMMTRTLAESLVRGVYLLTHRLLRENFTEAVAVKLHGKWQNPVPIAWRERNRVTIKLGMSPGERRRRVDSLGYILNTQLALADKGFNHILVNLPGFYQALMDWCRAAEIPNPEQYWLDPASDESKQALASVQNDRKQQQKAQQNLMDVALGLEQLRIALDKRNADADRVLKYFEAILSSETKQAEIVGGAVAKLEEVRAQAAISASEREDSKEALGGIDKALAAIKDLRSGSNGRATGN